MVGVLRESRPPRGQGLCRDREKESPERKGEQGATWHRALDCLLSDVYSRQRFGGRRFSYADGYQDF